MNRIKELRKNKGVTVKELSEIIGISQSMLSNYENGNSEPRDKETWQKLADYFGVSVAYIRGYNSQITIQTNNHEELIQEIKKSVNKATEITNDVIENALEDVAIDFSESVSKLIDEVIKNITTSIIENAKYTDNTTLRIDMNDVVETLKKAQSLLNGQKDFLNETAKIYKVYKQLLEYKKKYDAR